MYPRMTFDQFLQERIGVMDSTAVTLCRDNAMPIRVFKMATRGNIKRVVLGDSRSAPSSKTDPAQLDHARIGEASRGSPELLGRAEDVAGDAPHAARVPPPGNEGDAGERHDEGDGTRKRHPARPYGDADDERDPSRGDGGLRSSSPHDVPLLFPSGSAVT